MMNWFIQRNERFSTKESDQFFLFKTSQMALKNPLGKSFRSQTARVINYSLKIVVIEFWICVVNKSNVNCLYDTADDNSLAIILWQYFDSTCIN